MTSITRYTRIWVHGIRAVELRMMNKKYMPVAPSRKCEQEISREI